MNKRWLITILGLTFSLLAVLKTHEVNSLKPYIHSQRTLKLENFSSKKSQLSAEDQELLELWESMLTGRSAPLSKLMKQTYQKLGLNHVFTPSGFHLSAVMAPFLRLTSSVKIQLSLLLLVGFGISFLPGMMALKRMVLIKSSQKLTNLKTGFVIALTLDVLFGSFQNSAVSFTYSFLFLGIIYSGAGTIGLTFWFFIGQVLLAYFQKAQISPLLIFWCPIINFSFAVIMPLLFLLSFPLWEWQLKAGLFLLKAIQMLINFAAQSLSMIPFWEINIGMLFLILCFAFNRKTEFIMGIILLSFSLNSDLKKYPGPYTNEFRPQGQMTKIKDNVILYTDGRCQMELIQGHWWKKCRPSRHLRL